MSQLNTKPNSSSKRQHQVLVMAARRVGVDLAEIRKAVGGSLRRLSAQQCSDWIKRYSGQGLKQAPGTRPQRRKSQQGVTRMIAPEQIQQIDRLLRDFFPKPHGAAVWLIRNFKVERIKDLATAKRAGEVIRVLKTMLSRKVS